jgi:hypothetical protein
MIHPSPWRPRISATSPPPIMRRRPKNIETALVERMNMYSL